MNIILKKNESTGLYDVAVWESKGTIITLEFPYEISAKYADKIQRVIIEKYSTNKIGFHTENGTLEFDADIPSLDGYKFRGINKNLTSASGVALLFFPAEPASGNKWRDVEQYELIESNNCLGKYLGIYR